MGGIFYALRSKEVLDFSFRIFIFFLTSCALGTGSSFKPKDIRSFKGTLIPELSNNPILIEKVSMFN